MPYIIRDLAREAGAGASGNDSLEIHGLAEPAEAGPADLAIAIKPEFAESLHKGEARAAIFGWEADWESFGLQAALFTLRPRYSFMVLTRLFAPALHVEKGIHPTVQLAPGTDVGKDVSIGPFTSIGEGVRIGDGCAICANVSIGPGSTLGPGSVVREGVRIGWGVSVGKRCVVHPNVVIGCDGYSYFSDIEAVPEAGHENPGTSESGEGAGMISKIYSLGSVRIGDDVEIGACSVIDRGTISTTEIGPGTKIDNQVHIAHNVKIGKNCFICGQVGVAGSATIGDCVALAGMTGVSDHVTVGDRVVSAGAAKIFTNVPSGRTVMGSPAISMDKNIELYKSVRRLPRLFELVRELERRIKAQSR